MRQISDTRPDAPRLLLNEHGGPGADATLDQVAELTEAVRLQIGSRRQDFDPLWVPRLESLKLACTACGERPVVEHRQARWVLACSCADTTPQRTHWRAVVYWAQRTATVKPAWNNTPFKALARMAPAAALQSLERLRDYLELVHYRNVLRRDAGRPAPISRYERDLLALEATRLAIDVLQMDLPELARTAEAA